MKIEWMVLAEGLAQDSKGAFSLIGLNQNLMFADKLPTQTKRAVVVHLTGSSTDAAVEMGSASFTFALKSPEGATLIAQSGQIQGADFPFPDLPATADIPFDVVAPIPEYGTYLIQFDIRFATGETESSGIQFYVRPVSENPQFRSVLAANGTA